MPVQLGGPIWADAIHDVDFVKGLLSATKSTPSATYHTIQRITGLLTVISEVHTCIVLICSVQTVSACVQSAVLIYAYMYMHMYT